MSRDWNVGLLDYPDPPDEIMYQADCGCFVGFGTDKQESIGDWGGVYEWEGKYICPDCMCERLDELTLKEKAELCGSDFKLVSDLLERD